MIKFFQTRKSQPPQRIIVRMPNWIGDLVMATPILANLRHQWPEAKIIAMCASSQAALLENNPYIDDIFTFNKPKGPQKRSQQRAIVQRLRIGSYDLGILLTNSFSSAWWFWRAKIKCRLGYQENFRSWLLNIPVKKVAHPDKQHLVLTYKQLLKPLGIDNSSTLPKLFLTQAELEATQNFLRELEIDSKHDIIVGINPGAAYGSAKCWPPERFAELVRRLAVDQRIVVLVFGDPTLVPLAEQIAGSTKSKRIINLAGKTQLRELLCLIHTCDLLITNDSGPMHIAAALGTRLIALFGSTNEVATGPYHPDAVVIHKHVACSPCYLRKCPIDFRCMKQIQVDEVYQKARHILFPTIN